MFDDQYKKDNAKICIVSVYRFLNIYNRKYIIWTYIEKTFVEILECNINHRMVEINQKSLEIA